MKAAVITVTTRRRRVRWRRWSCVRQSLSVFADHQCPPPPPQPTTASFNQSVAYKTTTAAYGAVPEARAGVVLRTCRTVTSWGITPANPWRTPDWNSSAASPAVLQTRPRTWLIALWILKSQRLRMYARCASGVAPRSVSFLTGRWLFL